MDDLVQTSMIDVLHGISGYRSTGSFSGWVNRITMHAISRHFRRKSIWAFIPASDIIENNPIAYSMSQSSKIDEQRLLDRVAEHMKKVKQKNRTALALSLVQGYTAKEIAEIIGCSREAAKKRLTRGRQELYTRLKQDEECQVLLEGLW